MNAFRPPSSGDPREQRIIEALLAAVQRPQEIDPEAEQRAVAAFRLAKLDAGKPDRSRHLDDWRPARLLGFGGAWRAALAALVATCALGGAAYATFFALPARHVDGPGPASRPSSSTSAGLSHPSASPDEQDPDGPDGTPGGPPSAQVPAHERARCRAYLKDPARAAAKHPDDYRELVRAAGGERNLRAYCTAAAGGSAKDGKAGKEKPEKNGKNKKEKGDKGKRRKDGKGRNAKPEKPGTPSPTGTSDPEPIPETPAPSKTPKTPHKPEKPHGPDKPHTAPGRNKDQTA
ncbi:hypothetical protein [Streptomyces sp. TS71-3]|uniref:hypothetical protein n=1 Tax=Streptomyces sp. TS71-3 TaxID=2733862 RepID=UPI001B172F1D|nr:hypothetical protein [Streptomyces sp. TS71-3]GHJ35945.1 hypothetical protein Sm713_15540 [Streptomyces sp. TS71-3]